MEPDDVVGQDPAVDLVADHRRQHAPGVRLAPRDVDEVVQERVRAGAADQARERVQVIVVDHHHGFVGVLDLLEHGAGEVLVDDVVAELECLGLVAADVRGVRQVPEVVLDEPQQRVGDDVVEAVVGLGIRLDQLHQVLVAVGRLDRERTPPVAPRRGRVLLGHRRGDPGDLAVGREPDQGRHQSSGPPSYLSSGPKVTGPRLDTSTSGGLSHYTSSCSKTLSQSRSSRGIRKRRRTDSLPARPSCLPSPGSFRTSSARPAHSSTVDTRNPARRR